MKKINYYISILKANPRIAFLILVACILVIFFVLLVIVSVGGVRLEKTEEINILTEDEKIQNEADKDYGDKLQIFTEKYPWYDNLPPKNSKYFIAFDDGEKTFYVSLYSKNNPALTEDYKKQVFLDLEKIGVATESFGFNWTIR